MPGSLPLHTNRRPLSRLGAEGMLGRRGRGRGRRRLAFVPLVALVAAVCCACTTPAAPGAEAGVDPVETAHAARPENATPRRTGVIRPEPRSAVRDRGQANADGCELSYAQVVAGPCTYGQADSPHALVLLGDSHAGQYAPALDIIARRRGWRLVVLSKSGCSPASVPIYNGHLGRRFRECETWRANALRRIAREDPVMVVVGNSSSHATMAGDRPAGPAASARALEAGLATTLRRLRQGRSRVVVMRDNPRPRGDVRDCVSRSRRTPGVCAFPRRVAYGHHPVNTLAARAVPGVTLIDVGRALCPTASCPAVVGDVLIYRNSNHITATFMQEFLAPWIDRRLPRMVTPRTADR